MCFAGLMEFKELFGSFTGHRVENRSTGMRYESTGSARSEKWKIGFLGAVGDGVQAVGDALQISPYAHFARNQSIRPSAKQVFLGARRRRGQTRRRRVLDL
ncbi:hypothetical protein HanRHA438_Chr14g0678021 [Helianthus annuus]|nr:hypothetical protein HanRHA438_Chr14g0678021 [Helianthus annuus]